MSNNNSSYNSIINRMTTVKQKCHPKNGLKNIILTQFGPSPIQIPLKYMSIYIYGYK